MDCNAGGGSVLESFGSGVTYDEIVLIDPRGKMNGRLDPVKEGI